MLSSLPESRPTPRLSCQTRLVDLNLAGDVTIPQLTVVIPTRNERKNIELLLARLAPAIAPLSAEARLRRRQRRRHAGRAGGAGQDLPRPGPACFTDRRAIRKAGLSSAVIAGARHARGEWVLVMDGGTCSTRRSRPVVLASTAMRYDSDIVVGTRYAGGRSAADGLGSTGRVAGVLIRHPAGEEPVPPQARHG